MARHQDWTIIKQLGDVILRNAGGCIFEIGLGKSTPVLLKFARSFKRDHYCFDKKQRKCDWAEQHGCKVFLGNSLDFLKEFPDIPVAMGLIDGDHQYKIAVQEFDFFVEKLSTNGVIFLHDTFPPFERWVQESGRRCGNVYKLRQELEARDDIQVFTWPYTAANCGLTMVMKKEPNRPYYRI